MKQLNTWSLCIAFIGCCFYTSVQAQSVPEEQLIFYTQEWEGERYPDGRPRVPDDILNRMEHVGLEEAWAVMRQKGYNNQFEGNWDIMYPDRPVIGRALTATYMPSSPGLMERMIEKGRAEGRKGPMNTWPIDMLRQGDVYVANGFGKVKDGTLIGDRLGNTIFANSGNGVVFDGSSRDLEGLQEIEGFNAFVRAWHPSYLQEMMLIGLNVPTRIGQAVVLPGDVVLAKEGGVVFIPAYLAEEVVRQSEIIRLTDAFAHRRVQDGIYTAGEMDMQWTEPIEEDFFGWLEENKSGLSRRFGIPEKTLDSLIESRDI